MRSLIRQLTGAGTLPFSHDAMWGFAKDAGKRQGSLKDAGQTTKPPLVEYFGGMVSLRSARRARRHLKRYRKHSARAESGRREAEARGPRMLEAAESGEPTSSSASGSAASPRHAVVDFMVRSPVAYLLTYGLVVFVLEAAGMLTSLVAFDQTLGGFRIPMALAAGAILVLAGHGIGHVIHEARGRNKQAKRAFAVGVLIVLCTGLWTISALGEGRDANLEAADELAAGGTFRAEAVRLRQEADGLVGPAAARARRIQRSVPPTARRAAARRRAQAATADQEAVRAERRGRNQRTLGFFVAVQSLGLIVGALGGFLWAGGGPMRDVRTRRRLEARARKSEARALRHRDRVRLVVEEECGLAKACHGGYATEFYVARKGLKTALEPLAHDPGEIATRLLADGSDRRDSWMLSSREPDEEPAKRNGGAPPTPPDDDAEAVA